MIFVTGPMYSGKEKCICDMLGITHEEFLERGVRDAEKLVMVDAKKLVSAYAKKLVSADAKKLVSAEAGKLVSAEAESFFSKSDNPLKSEKYIDELADELAKKDIVIASEIGGGVISTAPEVNAYRERAGRLSQELAKRADVVVRVICGLPQILKGEIPGAE